MSVVVVVSARAPRTSTREHLLVRERSLEPQPVACWVVLRDWAWGEACLTVVVDRAVQQAGGVLIGHHAARGGWEPGRWTRVAVLRVPPANWHLLPPHLIPPSRDVMGGVAGSAVRDRCKIPNGYGDVGCYDDWSVRRATTSP